MPKLYSLYSDTGRSTTGWSPEYPHARLFTTRTPICLRLVKDADCFFIVTRGEEGNPNLSGRAPRQTYLPSPPVSSAARGPVRRGDETRAISTMT